MHLQYTTKPKMRVKINVVNHALILILNSFDAFPIICTLQCFKCFEVAFLASSVIQIAILCIAMLCVIS